MKRKIKLLKILSLIIFLLSVRLVSAQVRVPRINIEDFTGTEEQANEKITELEALIADLESEGIDVTKEKMNVNLAKVFLFYANWDEDNKAINEGFFDGLHTFHETTAANLAEHLPAYERSSVIEILEEAIATLTAIKAGDIIRKPTPVIDWEEISYDGNQLIHAGKPVFLADYVWKESKAGTIDLQEYFGGYDGFYVDAGMVENGGADIKQWLKNNLNAKEDGSFGTMFIGHGNVPSWLETKYPNIRTGGSIFTKYDIDNPGTKEVIGTLLDGVVPLMKGKNYTGQGYMLSNEPHWNIAGTWAVITFSDYTKDKFKVWLEEKHAVISNLNTLWGTSYASFNDVVTPSLPMSYNEIGTPRWYDMVRFNQERVIDWFTWLNNKVVTHDPDAKTHIKVIPGHWAHGTHIQGLDFEALTALTGNIGNDAGAKNSYRWGGPYAWEDRYAFEWREISMPYDFFRSIAPNKVNYNSEGHYIQNVAFSDLFLDESYVRSVNWLSVLQGMNSIKSWFWPRSELGALDARSQTTAGSLAQQPKVVNEITSTFMDLNAHSEDIAALQSKRQSIRVFYSETSTINKSDHMDELFELYEALYFEGESIGFATKNIIETQSNTNWDVILVNRSEYVKIDELNALQTYLDNGGTIILDAVSLKNDEYGRAHTVSLNTNNGGVLMSGGTVDDFKTKALDLIKDKGNSPRFIINETNSIGQKGCLWRSYTSSEGEEVINIINIGKTEATLELGLIGTNNTLICTNLLTGETLDANFTMAPETVYLLSVRERTIEDNRFTITTTSETCPNQDNGKIHIVADIEQNYIVSFNSNNTNFTKEVTLESIAPETYEFCITVEGESTSKCYNVEIKEASEISGKSAVNIKSSTLSVDVNEGTAPFTISVNNKIEYQTNATSFEINVNHGDIVQIKTDVACEGLMVKNVDFLQNIKAYPNPTTGLVELEIPLALKSVPINIYGIQSQLISSKEYNVFSGKVNLDLQNVPKGVYFIEVLFDKPVNLKIVKK